MHKIDSLELTTLPVKEVYAILKKKGGGPVKTLRYDPKSIRSGLTLVTLLCWILPILIIVTMFSVLVNYYNDRNLEQAMDLCMENAMQQV